ncbi:MAG TPA: 23S rRNA (adenine(2503)-C(2))-methyltransferase RlmN, partial [Dehalococcoidia bacterium]|nr:23S rRNA (adenine(2503)-C(2))-methyltransferase RlmN [Dehalococcoidia bacterium]
MPRQATSLLDLDPAEVYDYLQELGQPGYRARQVLTAIYRRLIFDPAKLGDLPLNVRALLAEGLPVLPVEPLREQVAADGQTRKWLFKLPDGKTVETVLMEYNRRGSRPRRTVCLSSQVGCAIGCVFCATGRAGLTRNLSVGEIVGQVLWVARFLADRRPAEAVTNLVFMGQGEPLQNRAATFGAIERLNDPDLFGLGARHMTVSTSGLAPGIRALADFPYQVNLAVSIHAPNDELRTRLVPINIRYPIAEVLDACRYYIDRTHRRVTFEYV